MRRSLVTSLLLLLPAVALATVDAKKEPSINAPAGQKFEYVLQNDCIDSVKVGDCRGPGPRDLKCHNTVITLKPGKKLEDCENINVYRQPAEKLKVSEPESK